jgi:hypothetical protein
MNLKETYFRKANNLYSRLLGEAPEDEITPDATADVGTDDETETETDDTKDEIGQSEQIEIYFDNLDEQTQKVLLDALKENLNVVETDEFAQQKIIDILAQKALMTLRAEELVRKLNINI